MGKSSTQRPQDRNGTHPEPPVSVYTPGWLWKRLTLVFCTVLCPIDRKNTQETSVGCELLMDTSQTVQPTVSSFFLQKLLENRVGELFSCQRSLPVGYLRSWS